MRRFAAVFLVMTMVAGLAMAAEGENIAGKRFVLTRVNGEAWTSEREVFVEIGDDFKLAGRICNNFHGPATFQNGILTAENLASTRMLCLDGNLSKLENDIFKALRGGVSVLQIGDGMDWRRDASIWHFARADAAATEKTDKTDKDEPTPSPAAGGVEAQQLSGKKFILQQVDGNDFTIKMGRQPFIEFSLSEEGFRVNGSACNNFMGQAELSEGTLTMANAASTMMMCADPQLSTFERDFHKLLRGGVTLELKDGILTLRGAGRVLIYKAE